jgi:hypothetical protein
MQIRTIFLYGLVVLAFFLFALRMWLVNGPETPNETETVTAQPTPLDTDEVRVIELNASETWKLVGKGPLRITATGTVDLGNGLRTVANDEKRKGDASTTAPDLPYGTLVARLGENGKPFKIGIRGQIAAKDNIYLAINDGDRSDNSGSYVVTLMGGTKY